MGKDIMSERDFEWNEMYKNHWKSRRFLLGNRIEKWMKMNRIQTSQQELFISLPLLKKKKKRNKFANDIVIT